MRLRDRCTVLFKPLRKEWPTAVGAAVVLTLTAVVIAGTLHTDTQAESLGPQAATATPDLGATTTPGSSSPSPTSTSRPVAPSRKPSRIIAWIRDFAPMGGGSGPHDGAFSSVVQDDCATAITLSRELAEPQRSLYAGAGAACLAAFHNQLSRWAQAEALLPTVTRRQAELVCFDRLVYPLLRDLVALHQQNPALRLLRGSAPAHSQPRCPNIVSVTPSHGPLSGGYVVRLTGEHLPPNVVVHFGDRDVHAAATNGGTLVYLVVPPASEPGEISVWVEGWPFAPYASFTYDAPAAPLPSTASAPAVPVPSAEVSMTPPAATP